MTSRLGRWDRNRRLRALKMLITGLPLRRSLLRSRVSLCDEQTGLIPRDKDTVRGEFTGRVMVGNE